MTMLVFHNIFWLIKRKIVFHEHLAAQLGWEEGRGQEERRKLQLHSRGKRRSLSVHVANNGFRTKVVYISQACYVAEIYHSGPEPSKW